MDLRVLSTEVRIEVVTDEQSKEKRIKGRIKEKALIRVHIWVVTVRG